MGYKPIEDYGVIGDLHTVALVGKDGAIDFMCFPRFDSPTMFAALLDDERGGHFRISPVLADVVHKQLYLPDTNVLLTRFLSDAGVAELSDFMPVEETGWINDLVRRVKTVRGEVAYQMWCAPRFDYARAAHRVDKRSDNEVVFICECDESSVRLRSNVPLEVRGGDVVSHFRLPAGEHAWFVLEKATEGQPCHSGDEYVTEAFKRTSNFWRNWISRSTYRGRWRDHVNRSALVLKLLTSQEFGSLVAAPTFGLPEELGGSRNWDYRFTWIRDASFTLYALIRLGLVDESRAFNQWLEARCAELAPDGSLQLMYGLDGRHRLDETVLENLEGYRRSQPVRIGNEAYRQLQLDIYGELLDSIYLYDKYGEPMHYALWDNIVRLLEWVCQNWSREDEGIWEVRGRPLEFLHSRLMCWVAIDRGVRLAQKRSLPAPVTRWRETRDLICRNIHSEFWDAKRQTFTQSSTGTAVDASSLLMPLVRFISPTDPRWLSTLRAIEEDLVEDSLVYRYRADALANDGLTGHEGTFSICSFWYTECLSRAGDVDKARYFFEKMLGYANHLGLYAEELGRRAEHLGNFPQAFTHLALISAAYEIDRRLDMPRR